jgi:hypothetical protein
VYCITGTSDKSIREEATNSLLLECDGSMPLCIEKEASLGLALSGRNLKAPLDYNNRAGLSGPFQTVLEQITGSIS